MCLTSSPRHLCANFSLLLAYQNQPHTLHALNQFAHQVFLSLVFLSMCVAALSKLFYLLGFLLICQKDLHLRAIFNHLMQNNVTYAIFNHSNFNRTGAIKFSGIHYTWTGQRIPDMYYWHPHTSQSSLVFRIHITLKNLSCLPVPWFWVYT